MRKGEKVMQILKIDDGKGLYLTKNGEYDVVDMLVKEDLMRLVNCVMDEDEVEIEAYDKEKIKNPAHQIIYESVAFKLEDLRGKRDSFIDEKERQYLEDYERYKSS